jgi:hypothetical protein
MQTPLANGVIQLVEGESLAFRAARNHRLECTAGVVWLTVEGQAGDFLIAQGEGVYIESNGLALVEGMPFGAIRLVSDAAWAKPRAKSADRPLFPRPMSARVMETATSLILGLLESRCFSSRLHV